MEVNVSLASHTYKTIGTILLILMLLTGFSVVPLALAETQESTCQGSCCESSDMQCCSQGAMGCCPTREPLMQNVTSTTAVLWSYMNFTSEFNRTAYFSSYVVEAENISVQFYRLTYLVQHLNYVLTLSTMLSPLSSETYNSSFTFMNYAPTEGYGITSLDVVVFNESLTLSQHYVALGEAAKEFGKDYEESGNETLMQLATAYYTMKEEAKYLSKLVEKQLQQYNWQILQSSALLMDSDDIYLVPIDNPDAGQCPGGGGGEGEEPPSPPTCTIECWIYELGLCTGENIALDALQCMWGCMWSSLPCFIWGPEAYAICLESCYAVCQIAAGVELIWCAISAMFSCECI